MGDEFIEIIGVQIPTSAGKISMSTSLATNLHRYQLYANIRAGGSQMIYPPVGTLDPMTGGPLKDGSYLQRLPAERIYIDQSGIEVDPFVVRATGSTNHPLVCEILDVYVSTLFRQPVDRRRVQDLVSDEIYRNVDLKGTPVDLWLSKAHRMGLADGAVAAVIDYPRSQAGSPASLLHEQASGVRPYATLIPVTSIWMLDRDMATMEILSIVIQTSSRTFRIWTPSAYADVTDTGEIIAEGANPYGFVPVVIYIAEDPVTNDEYAPLGLSAVRDSALMQIQYNQSASLLDSLEKKTNYPFLHIGDDPPAGDAADDIPLGPDYVIYGEADVGWVSPDPTAAVEARAHLDTIESRIHKIQGVHRRSQDSVEAHSGLALDYESSPIYATVQMWAQRLRVFEESVWRTFAAITGSAVDGDLVTYPEDFSTRPIDREISQGKSITDVFGGWSNSPAGVKIYVLEKIRRAMKRDLSYLPVSDEISRLMDDAIAEEPEPELAMREIQQTDDGADGNQ